MSRLNWKVLYRESKDGKVLPSKNNPKKSGQYLCTCVAEKGFRYLRVLAFDFGKQFWHDVGNEFYCSHTILAWADVDMCDATDFVVSDRVIYKVDGK